MGYEKIFLQQDRYSCGAISLANAIQIIGGELSVDDAKKIAGTTYRNGTTRVGIMRGVRSLGYKATPYHTRNPDHAWKWIKKHSRTCPLISLVDHHGHWLVIFSMGENVVTIDGSPNNGENGVTVVTKQDTLERLGHLGHYYLIRVSR